ncbi:hypothetical protein ACO2Q3_19665 [Caulobacter sp. KR2-114]|uniref:hypothetical protein n=1 Tax=Caulobacter sp. KR2-114 TaxID=3400912 RepID=UPI003C04280E
MRIVLLAGALGALTLGLAACGGHPTAVQSKDVQASGGGQADRSGAGGESGGGNESRSADGAPVRQVNGKPVWAANKRHGAEDNAQYQFGKHGSEFGAANEDDYVTRVHAFVDNPPSGAETINRSNGDRLIYDAHSNTFAVVAKDGAPRTMFKPHDGAAYWAQQKTREADRGKGKGDSADS